VSSELLLILSGVGVRTSYKITTCFGFIVNGNADYNNSKRKDFIFDGKPMKEKLETMVGILMDSKYYKGNKCK
jgi:hypothetical protein